MNLPGLRVSGLDQRKNLGKQESQSLLEGEGEGYMRRAPLRRVLKAE